jgi:MSHA biogenesis protein MshL
MKRTGLLLLSASLLLWGCSIPVYPRATDLSELEKEPLPSTTLHQEVKAQGLAPAAMNEELATASDGQMREEQLYTFSFSEQPLSEALNVLLADQPLSLSVDESVNLKRTVTVHMRNGTLKEALDLVVGKGAGYIWKLNGDRLDLSAYEERMYQFDYLDMATTTDIDVGGDMLGAGVTASGVSGKYSVKNKREEKKTDVWGQIGEVLTGLKSKNGKLQINRGAGLVYMVDTPETLAAMVRFLDALKETLQRQVYIEARILDVQLNDEFRYGIDWTAISAAINPGKLNLDFMNISGNGGSSLILSENTGFSAVIDLLATQGDISVLSNPHISVMNNQSAIMTVGSQFPFADITGVSRDQLTNVVTIDGTIKRAVFGLQLGITPYIAGDGMVTLHIVPTITRNEGNTTVTVPVGGAGNVNVENPVIGLQELATTVRVREGQSVVLAGLISQEKSQQTNGIPWLRKIPVLGFFFGHGAEIKKNRELVILIKPFIRKPG